MNPNFLYRVGTHKSKLDHFRAKGNISTFIKWSSLQKWVDIVALVIVGLDRTQQSKLDQIRAEENVCTVMKWPSLQNKCEQIYEKGL